jgi:F-type H+-transporting ATPase subunit alpha
VGLSVSRVGGAAQIAVMKKVAGMLRLELAQYRALAAFAQFGSDLDKATQQQLARGSRMTELLKQGQYVPLPVEKQVLILFAGANGFVDSLPLSALDRYERDLYAFVDGKHPALWGELRSKGTDGKAFDVLAAQMRSVLAEFAKEFAATLQTAP